MSLNFFFLIKEILEHIPKRQGLHETSMYLHQQDFPRGQHGFSPTTWDKTGPWFRLMISAEPATKGSFPSHTLKFVSAAPGLFPHSLLVASSQKAVSTYLTRVSFSSQEIKWASRGFQMRSDSCAQQIFPRHSSRHCKKKKGGGGRGRLFNPYFKTITVSDPPTHP